MPSEPEQELRLAELLCSRLCHDLVSPIGAIHNGLELLAQNESEMEAEILGLLSKSSAEASRRLRFFRVAFGQAGGSADALSLEEGKELMGGFLKEGRVGLDWKKEDRVASAPVARGAVKLLLNMALVASEALPKGGTVSVAPICRPGETLFEVTAQGDGAALKEEVASALRLEMSFEALTPRIAPAYFLAFLMRRYEFSLQVLSDADRVVLRAVTRPKP